MSKEIERKFLVNGNPWETYPTAKVSIITQGYLSKSLHHTIRVRLKDTRIFSRFEAKAFITIKGPRKGITCDEFEYEIPYADAKLLLLMCDGRLVEKTRYSFVDQHHQFWEVDEFTGINEGLVVAEIELKSEKTEVILPAWVGEEVSFDKRYTNSYLSTHKVVDK